MLSEEDKIKMEILQSKMMHGDYTPTVDLSNLWIKNNQPIKLPGMELKKAQEIAQKIYLELMPYCQKILVAGSIRRLKPNVGDIEIVALPTMDEEPDGLFDVKKVVNRDFIRIVNSWERIKGDPTGRYAQRIIPVEGADQPSIKLDLFIPTESDFFRQVCIRTGDFEYSRRVIATGWLRKGWCGTENGLRLQNECEKTNSGTWVCQKENPTLPPAWESEEAFFQWIGVEYVAPEKRNG